MVAAKHGGVVERESKPTVHLGDDLRTPALFTPLQRLGVWAFSKGEAFQPTEAKLRLRPSGALQSGCLMTRLISCLDKRVTASHSHRKRHMTCGEA